MHNCTLHAICDMPMDGQMGVRNYTGLANVMAFQWTVGGQGDIGRENTGHRSVVVVEDMWKDRYCRLEGEGE
jgi:hypothetical protein